MLNLPADAIGELIELAAGADRLASIVVAAGQLKPVIGVMSLSKQLADAIGQPHQDVQDLVLSLANFYATAVRLKLSVEDTAGAVSDNILRSVKGEQGRKSLEDWERGKSAIVAAAKQLHPDHPLVASSKAYRVASSRQYELVDLRIFTDVRPVFNAAADGIVQSVISYVLSIDYHDTHDHKIIQFTLDASDVTSLKEACERAIRKTEVIKREFGGLPWPTRVFREPPGLLPESPSPDA